MPVPLSAAVCVPLGALSVSVSAPVMLPAEEGLKTSCSVHAALTASVEPQVLVAITKPALAVMLEIVSGSPPLLVSVSVCGVDVRPTPTLPKAIEAGLRETPGGATPVPVMATVCEWTTSLTVSVAVRVPVAVGVKMTENAQLLCPASEVPQLFTTLKSPGVMDAAMSVSGTSPALVSVTCCAALVVVICCCANVRDAGESVSVAGAWPVPVSAAVCVPMLSVMLSVPLRAPAAVGVNAIEIAQAVEAVSVATQVLAVMLKSPVSTGVCSVATVPPVLATVIVCAAVVWFMVVGAKVSEGGVSTMLAGAVPVPLRLTVAWPPPMLA